MKPKRPQRAKTIVIKKNKARGIIIPHFKVHCKSMTDEWSRIESSETNPCIYRQLIFDTEAKNIHWGKTNVFSEWENRIITYRRKKLDSYLRPLTKNSSKWIKELNIRLKTAKLLQKKIRKNLLAAGFGSAFFGYPTESANNQAKINKWDICTAKEANQQNEAATRRVGESICKPSMG